MKPVILTLYLLIATCSFAYSQKKEPLTPPLTYTVRFTDKPIKIDGKEEAQWKNANWTSKFIDIEGGHNMPLYNTKVKMLWDNQYFYFFADLKEPNLWATITKRDSVIFRNNDFEIFIDPDGSTQHYMEFEINALNTVWDLLLTKPYRNHPFVIDNWDIKGLKTAVKQYGTLNNPNDIDKGWTVEIAMPWSALMEVSHDHTIPEDKFWRLNFSRVNWKLDTANNTYYRKRFENGRLQPEYNWVWSPQGAIDMHMPENWGYVYFTKSKNDFFILPEDEVIKWSLYRVYKTIKQPADEGKIFIIKPYHILNKRIKVNFEYHQSGWNIWTVSPFTEKKIIITQSGESMITL